MECIAIINQKGGVGKTSTAVNLGAGLAQRGKRMLLIDLDPQGHLTTHFGLDGETDGRGIYDVLTKDLPLDEAIHPYSPTISIVPANVDLAAAEVELVSVVGREVILRDLLVAKERPFDIVMIDCPPSLGVLSLNALSAATRVLIPVQPHFLALQGAGKLFETISLVNQRLNRTLSVAGMVMCLYDAGTRLSAEVVDDLSAFLDQSRGSPVPWRDARIFSTVIRRNVKLAECPSYGQSIFEYAARSNGAMDYLALADELLSLLEGRLPAPAPAKAAGSEASNADSPGESDDEAAAAVAGSSHCDDTDSVPQSASMHVAGTVEIAPANGKPSAQHKESRRNKAAPASGVGVGPESDGDAASKSVGAGEVNSELVANRLAPVRIPPGGEKRAAATDANHSACGGSIASAAVTAAVASSN
ncbi:MAG: ParA family protein [Phycisphaerae bacterium]|nr:ParA family protein [Phycisphaerae bacterium]